MKYQCGFCKSDDVETIVEDREMIVMCQVCSVESVIEYPESIDRVFLDEKEEYVAKSWSERNQLL